jgi:hypothetical protein
VRTRRIRLLVAVPCLVLLGCAQADTSAPAPAGDFVFELPEGRPGEPNLLAIVDQTDLIVAVEMASDRGESLELSVRQASDPAGLVVSWVGLGCESRPVLTFAPAYDGFVLTLDHGPRPSSCAATGIGYSVELTLAEPLSVDVIALTELGEPTAPSD